MSFDALAAAKAYAQSAKAPLENTKAVGGMPDFGDMVANAVRGAQDTVHKAEATTQQVAAGEGDLVDAVTALTAAETTLETVVTVRNEVIRAYQEILRMPV